MRGHKSKPEQKGDALKVLNTLHRVGIPDAAALLDMHKYTLKEYIEKGYVQAIVIGCRMWITSEEIERYKLHGKRDPNDPASLEPEPFYGED